MNKPKRTLTLDSFVIKKSKNVSTTSFDSDLDQHGQVANAVSDISITNTNQHVITDCVNELISIVDSKCSQLFIHNNCYSSSDSTASNERLFYYLLLAIVSLIMNALMLVYKHPLLIIVIVKKRKIVIVLQLNQKNLLVVEKLISNLLSLKKFIENIDVLLKMFKSTNNSKNCMHVKHIHFLMIY